MIVSSDSAVGREISTFDRVIWNLYNIHILAFSEAVYTDSNLLIKSNISTVMM